jgi:hypothetical protein
MGQQSPNRPGLTTIDPRRRRRGGAEIGGDDLSLVNPITIPHPMFGERDSGSMGGGVAGWNPSLREGWPTYLEDEQRTV